MTNLLVHYQQEATSVSHSIPWVKYLQEEACQALKQFGLPAKSTEEWKYTPIDEQVMMQFKRPVPSKNVERLDPADIPSIGYHILLQNGLHVRGDQQVLPKGMIVSTLQEALTHHPDLVKPYLNTVLNYEHGFQALNTMMLQHGMFIYMPKHVLLEAPLVLSHQQFGQETAMYLRNLVVLEEGSQLTLVEDYQSTSDDTYFTNTVTEIYLSASAHLKHYKLQRESKEAFHIGHVAVRQSARSHFENHSLNLGGKLTRSDVSIELCEPHASCLMNGVYATTSGQHVDHHTTVKHISPHCESAQDYKGILTGRSKAVFNGRVQVMPHAIGTVAKQQNKNLMLSSHAEIDTKPELNIFADDVICTHGATVGQIDEEALFYLATRGIGREQAFLYLIRAFAVENFRAFHQEPLSEWMSTLLSQHLRGIV